MLFGKKKGIKNRNRGRYERVRRLMWIKCQACGHLVYYRDYKLNNYICPNCNKSFIMTPKQRFDLLFDDNTWEKIDLPRMSDDPLNFTDKKSYKDRLKDARTDTGHHEAIVTASGKIGGVPTTICILNGEFMMGSVGREAGDGIVASMDFSLKTKQPFIMVTCGGGMRMQENVLSLMQMARTTVAINKLHADKIPYIVLLTDPTYGGITASFAMLGDIHIAEKGARIGFAGRLVIEQNLREKLPADFQTAQYLYDHGMVDIVSPRNELKDTLAKILSVLTKQKKQAKEINIATPVVESNNKKSKRKNKDDQGADAAYEKVLLARNENRPHFLDYINGIVDDWVYLAGDRCFAEDPAMCSGIGFWSGIPSVIIGQEQGRTIETRQKHRFGMANPDGYRKAIRMMKLAEKFELPLISLFDTAGAFAGREAEERGQSQAVATSTAEGLKVRTPYITVNTGQGGSGGAIAIATGDKVLMMENSIYSVIAPESCASILWKNNKFKADAAKAMKLTAGDMKKLQIIDEIIVEPSGGAHTDWQTTMEMLSDAVTKSIVELQKVPVTDLPKQRGEKFIAMTRDIKKQ